MEYLTHKELEIRFTQFINGRGWKRAADIENSFHYIHPDGAYRKIGDQRIIVAEVKPDDASHSQILKGIGQCARYLPYKNIVPYFVISSEWFNKFKDTFKELPWLGIVTFSGNGNNMEIKQRSNRCM